MGHTVPQSSAKASSQGLNRSNSPNELPIVFSGEHQLVDARLLFIRLNNGYKFTTWIQARIQEFGFEEGKDFFQIFGKSHFGRPGTNYHLTLDMAKELAMLERSEAGRYFRRYFIEKEKELVAMKRQTLISSPTELFKGLKPLRIAGRKLYPYREILGRLGYSKKAGLSGKLRRYGQHFVLFGNIYYVTEEYARHMAASKAVYDNRKVVANMQPALPIDFGSTENLLGHGNI
jgi:phage anti-repressor protein